MTAPLDTLSADRFAPLVGEAFQLRGPGGHSLTVTLASCNENPRATAPGSPRTAFSLSFVCAAADAAAEGDHLLSHPSLGTIGPLYLGRVLAVGHPPGSAVYQAVFA